MRILVAVDLSRSTEKVVSQAESMATGSDSIIWFLHVADPEPDFVGTDIEPQAGRDALSRKYHYEHCRVQDIAESTREKGLDATALLVQGVIVETILQESDKLEADIIVVGSHGHGAMYQLLVGSVSEGVIHNTGLPTLVVPTHDRD